MGVQTKAVASSADPYFSNVVLLALNESGADGTTTFLDRSNAARALTPVGNAQWDSDVAPPGGLSSWLLLDGTGDAVYAADSTDFEFGSGDFTLEIWATQSSATSYRGLITKSKTSGSDSEYEWYINAGNKMEFYYYSPTLQSYIVSYTPAAGDHLAICRDGANLRFFQNGTQVGTTHNIGTSTIRTGTGQLIIGAFGSGYTLAFAGNLGAARITNIARYTANFIPPTLPLPTS